MKKSDNTVIEFDVKLPKLSTNEKSVLGLLVEAAKLIDVIYTKQKEEFKGVEQKEFEKAAKNNPQLLSHFTVVEKVDGKIVSTPYHIKFAELLKPVAEKLEKAAGISDNKDFAKALRVQAKALLEGTYEEAIACWLKTKPYILNISIGPLWYFDDELPFAKASYQAWVGVMDKEGTDRLDNYKTITFSARRKAILPENNINNLDKVKVLVVDVLVLAGFMRRAKFVGINLPVDVSIVEKDGSQVTLFNQCNDLRMEESIRPGFKAIFSDGFRQGYDDEDLRRGYLRTVALHQLAHSYLYYRDAYSRLKELFPIIDELAASVLGLRMASSLLLKDRITTKQLESMVVAFLARSSNLYKSGLHNSNSSAGAMFANYLIEIGAVKTTKEGFLVLNFMKIFMSLQDLSANLEQILALGSYKEAQSFINKYSR